MLPALGWPFRFVMFAHALLALGACRDHARGAIANNVDATAPDASASVTLEAGSVVDSGDDAGASRSAIIRALGAHRDVATLNKVPQHLPTAMLKNFVLKHGRLRVGERGHLVERRVSQSADPSLPRAILWDDASGTVVSYNGGGPGQKQGQRLDVLAFDDVTKQFDLEGIEVDAGHTGVRDCASCHETHQQPIFSMYPDWPSFYGSDNDELSNTRVAVQVAELADYRRFLATAARRARATRRSLPRRT